MDNRYVLSLFLKIGLNDKTVLIVLQKYYGSELTRIVDLNLLGHYGQYSRTLWSCFCFGKNNFSHLYISLCFQMTGVPKHCTFAMRHSGANVVKHTGIFWLLI